MKRHVLSLALLTSGALCLWTPAAAAAQSPTSRSSTDHSSADHSSVDHSSVDHSSVDHLSTAHLLSAQRPAPSAVEADARWLPWIGCWQTSTRRIVAETASELVVDQVCVTP